MKYFAVVATVLSLGLGACSHIERTTDMTKVASLPPTSTLDAMRAVSPALEHYTNGDCLAISGSARNCLPGIAASLR